MMTVRVNVLSKLFCAGSLLSILMTASCGHKDAADSSLAVLGVPQNLPTLAGGEKGNGGDAVVCFSDPKVQEYVRSELFRGSAGGTISDPFAKPETMKAVSSVELLDLYEYKLPTGFPPKRREIITISDTFQQAVPRIFTRIEKKSAFATKLRNTFKTIPLDHWHASPGVVEINDSSQAFLLPPECLLIQAAARLDNQVYYDEHLWSRMDELNHTALVLHEVVYKIAVERGETNSQRSRQLVGLALSKDDFETQNAYQIYKQLTAIGEPSSSIGEFAFDWMVDGNQVQVQKVFSESGAGSPNKMIIDPKMVSVYGVKWQLQVQPTVMPNIELSEKNRISRLFGWPIDASEFKFKNVASVGFEAELIHSISFNAPSSIEVNSRKWESTWKVAFLAGKLHEIDGATVVTTNLGRISISGNMLLDTNRQTIVKAAKGYFQFGGTSVTSGELNFDAMGQLVSARSLSQSESHSVVLDNGMIFEARGDDFQFYPEGKIAQIDFAANRQTKVSWDRESGLLGVFWNVLSMEFDPGVKFTKAKFDPLGILEQGTPYTRTPVPNKTVRYIDGKFVIED